MRSQPEVIHELEGVDQISVQRHVGDGVQPQDFEHGAGNRRIESRRVQQSEIGGRRAIGRTKRLDHFAGKRVLQLITPGEFRMGRFRHEPSLDVGMNRVEQRLRHFLELDVNADAPGRAIAREERDIARRNDHASAGRRHENRRVLARGLVELDGGSRLTSH